MRMMLILILSLALLAAAFFTRPSKESFTGYLDSKKPIPSNASVVERVLRESERDAEIGRFTFKDKWLWVEMTQDEKARYIGAFSHWFDKSEPTSLPRPAAPAK